MSTEQNKQLVRRYYEEVVSSARLEKLPEFIAEDYVEIHNNQRHNVGLDGARQHILGVNETYGALMITVERQIAEGDWVVTLITAHGIHAGSWMGIEPTGKAVEFTGVNVDRVMNGRIVEHGGAANMLEPLLEIGAVRIGPG